MLSDDERRRLRGLADQLEDANLNNLEREVGGGRAGRRRRRRWSLTAWAERRFYARQIGDGRW